MGNKVNSETLYPKILLLSEWLRGQTYKSNVELPQSLSWMNLEWATGSYISPAPGFYVVRLVKSSGHVSDIVYIGETTYLPDRISALRATIRMGTVTHAGGGTLRKKLGSDLSQLEICWLKTLNVYTAKLFERYLILSFYEGHGVLPIGNKQ